MVLRPPRAAELHVRRRAIPTFGGEAMRSHWLLALTVGLLTAAADTPEQAKAKELAALQGDWRVDWVERDGERGELDADAVYTIKGEKWLKGEREVRAIAQDPGSTAELLERHRVG